MTMAMPVLSLKHFTSLMESVKSGAEPFPFYSVLLYAPGNGLDGRLHDYMRSHWELMDGLTGRNWLLLAVEDPQDAAPAIGDFRPEDVYEIGRHLGVAPDSVPCLAFFVDPTRRNQTLVLPLREFVSTDAPPDDAQLTDLFRSLATVVDAAAAVPAEERLPRLSQGMEHEWPTDSEWSARAAAIGGIALGSVATAGTTATALTSVLTVLSRISARARN